jgi:hypothetical protein
MTVAFASFSGFHGNVILHYHWKYSLLALLQPCSGGVSLQNFTQNRLNCEYMTLSRQASSTCIAKHRSFIKLKFLQNFCSSCKTLADQVARNPRFYCTLVCSTSRWKTASTQTAMSCLCWCVEPLFFWHLSLDWQKDEYLCSFLAAVPGW